ncbi:hypothetical protein Tco_0988416 [Tanacetum coccineum]|uniref:Uncharacterized protein n=1 Tax=Tanacetum coccineum TaxID=301880 RepID=A0ABQ5ERG5_9ASTR
MRMGSEKTWYDVLRDVSVIFDVYGSRSGEGTSLPRPLTSTDLTGLPSEGSRLMRVAYQSDIGKSLSDQAFALPGKVVEISHKDVFGTALRFFLSDLIKLLEVKSIVYVLQHLLMACFLSLLSVDDATIYAQPYFHIVIVDRWYSARDGVELLRCNPPHQVFGVVAGE